MTVSDIIQFIAHWILIGVLITFVVGTLAWLMGLVVVPRWWKGAAFMMLGFLVVIALLGVLLK